MWPPPQPVRDTAAEAIRALSLQMPGFRRQMNEGWYQIRIRGEEHGTGGGVRPSSRTSG
ncbi:hypothetical protein EFE38_28780 [Escherichia coli O157:H7]|nr:hypothetical protein EFE38_28780 [Escherichia coli O157:H7]